MKCSKAHTTARSFSSFVLYRSSRLFLGYWLAYAIGCQLESNSCSKHAPSPFLLASQRNLVGQFTLNSLFSVIALIASFIFVNDSVCSWLKSGLFCGFRILFESSDRSGLERVAKLGMKFIR